MGRVALARAAIGIATLATLVVFAAGCAQSVTIASSGDGRAVDREAVSGGGVDCSYDGKPNPSAIATSPTRTPLPADAVLVLATRCLFQDQPVPGDGEWLMLIHQKATSGLDALATALRLPSQPPVWGQGCSAVYPEIIIITVTDTAGREIHPKVPHDSCGFPLKAAKDAIAAVPWTRVSTTKVRRVRSELEVSSGCFGSAKSEIPRLGDFRGRARVVRPNTTARALRVCRYSSDDILWGNGRPWVVAGKLVSVSTLDAAAGGELLRAVVSAPRATGTCAQPAAPFALVNNLAGPGPAIGMTIERGGCYRIYLYGENYVRQLDAALVNRLVG